MRFRRQSLSFALADMKRPLRSIVIAIGTALLLVVGLIVYFALCANDVITFTKKTHSIALPGGRILNIYRTSLWEEYDFKFELLEAGTKKVRIPQTHFAYETYWGSEIAGKKSTPESRTAYVPLIGVKSGIVGLIGPEDIEHVLLLIDPAKAEWFYPNSMGSSDDAKKLGEKLLLALRADFPTNTLVLSGTREDALLKRERDIEHCRLTFARMDMAVQLGTTFSNAVKVSWNPFTTVTNSDGLIEARFCDDHPSLTWLGPMEDARLTNGFVLLVSNGIVVGKKYLSITSY